MARPIKGSLSQLASGEWRLRWGNAQNLHHFGPDSAGWSAKKLEAERQFVLDQLKRGVYLPQTRAEQAPAPAPGSAPTFAIAAANFFADFAARHQNENTVDVMRRSLSYVMDTFGPLPVDAITIGAAKTYVSAMLDERRRLQDLAAAGQTELITINARNGRTWQQRRRALSNSSINKGIVAAMRVLDDAKDDGYLITVSNLNKAKLPEPPPYRGIVEPIQLEYLLRAAAELEELARGLTWEKVRYIRETSHSAVRLGRELGVSDTLVRRVRRGELWNGEPGPRNRNDVARRAPLLFYALAGARVEEGVGVDGRHLDLASHPGTVHIAGTKTSAGDRKVPLVPALRDALIAHRADYQFGARDPMLSTRNGRRNTPSNLTKAVFAPAFERANEALEADGREPIPKLTPHVMRRTFASILYVCEVSQRRAIALMGHADYKITAQVYQQELDLSDESIDALQRVMGCSLEEAYELFRGRSRRTQRPGVVVPKLYGPEKRLATPSPGGERVS